MNIRILVVGSVNVDTIVLADEMPAVHTKTRGTIWQGPGGSAANTASWLASLGFPVALASVLGAGADADEALAALAARKVDLSGVVRDPGAPSRAMSLVTAGEKRIITSNTGRRVPRLDDLRPLLTGRSHLHLATTPSEELSRLVREAVDCGLTTSLELAGRPCPEWAGKLDLIFLNRDELTAHRGDTVLAVPESWNVRPECTVVVTCGADGAVALRDGEIVASPPARSAPLVDPTGGGDAFDAGYLGSWLRGAPPEAALQAGLDTAISARSHVGGCSWI